MMPPEELERMHDEQRAIAARIREDLNALSLLLLEVFDGADDDEQLTLSLAEVLAWSGELEPLAVFQCLCSTWKRRSLTRAADLRRALHLLVTDEPLPRPNAA